MRADRVCRRLHLGVLSRRRSSRTTGCPKARPFPGCRSCRKSLIDAVDGLLGWLLAAASAVRASPRSLLSRWRPAWAGPRDRGPPRGRRHPRRTSGPLPIHERRDIVQGPRDRRRWQDAAEAAAVAHGLQPRIEDRQDAAIVAVPQQPPEALQRQDRQRHLQGRERIAAARRDRSRAARRRSDRRARRTAACR